MKPIYLNHNQMRQVSLLGWAVLCLGTVSLVATSYAFWHVKSKQHAQEHQSDAPLKPQPSLTVKVTDENKLPVKNAIETIVIPWSSLLRSLEAANHEQVKMLVLDPSAKTRTLRLSLVAMDQASMWAYLENLKKQTALHDVQLISNEVIELNGISAQKFQVGAKW